MLAWVGASMRGGAVTVLSQRSGPCCLHGNRLQKRFDQSGRRLVIESAKFINSAVFPSHLMGALPSTKV